jgi:hypothetical protein
VVCSRLSVRRVSCSRRLPASKAARVQGNRQTRSVGQGSFGRVRGLFSGVARWYLPVPLNFEETHEDHEVFLNNENFSPGVGNAVRRSAIAQGRPVLTREWRAKVLNGGIPLGEDAEPLFSVETFDLLAGLHEDPTKAYYQEHREAIRDHVEEPFQWLVRQVAHRLPAPITGLMETEKGVFAKILKNDYGRGERGPFIGGRSIPRAVSASRMSNCLP